MDETPDQGKPIEIDAFAWASFITGAISLFFAERLFYPVPDAGYFWLGLIPSAGGIAAAVVAHQRIRGNSTLRGKQLALAGGLMSLLSGAMLVLSEILINYPP